MAANTDFFFSAAAGMNRPPRFTAFFLSGRNGFLHRSKINLTVGRIQCIQRIRSQDFRFRQVHAKLPDIFLIDAEHLHIPVFITEHSRRTGKAVEEKGFHGVRIPEPFCL